MLILCQVQVDDDYFAFKLIEIEEASSTNKPHCADVPLTGENALQRYDHTGLRRIRESALADRCGGIHQLTFLRMGNLMFDHWGSFTHLVSELSHDDEDL